MSEVKVNKISPRTNCGTVTVGDSGDSVSVTAGVPVTVNGDLKSNALKATDGGSIISQSGTTITLGASGDTVSLASGASQTGFGRTGTVDWQTGSIKTATFTAASGEGYFCNTGGGSFIVNLPAGSAGAIVSIQDYNNTFDTASLTVTPNGSEKINSGVGKITLNTEGEGVTLVYVDATVGWRSIHQSTFADVGDNSEYVVATGGTITTVGNYKIHTFTGAGTFTVSAAGNACGSNKVDYLVLAGGGGGSADNTVPQGGAGGGAGGYRESVPSPAAWTASPLAAPAGALTVTAQAYPIVVDGGGAGSPGGGTSGGVSTFSTITSAGGGRGGFYANVPGSSGGSGGGGGAGTSNGGSGNTPPVSPPQGNNGTGSQGSNSPGAGGGAGAAASGENGGAGTTSSINNTPTTRAGGGGGNGGGGSSGGPGGGGAGGPAGVSAPANSGSGGGGGSTPSGGGNGGSGLVILRYLYQGS